MAIGHRLRIRAKSERLHANSFEKSIAEGSVRLCGTIKIGEPLDPCMLIEQPHGKGLFFYPFDHGDKGLAGKTVDQGRAGCIHVNHAR